MSPVTKVAFAAVMALAGALPANASPTWHESCFDTEAAAQKQQGYYAFRETDNSEATEKVKRTRALLSESEHIKLSDLEAILGASTIETDDTTSKVSHRWMVTLTYSSSASDIRYDSGRGYCLQTVTGRFSSYDVTWHPSGYDSLDGKAELIEFHY